MLRPGTWDPGSSLPEEQLSGGSPEKVSPTGPQTHASASARERYSGAAAEVSPV